jgi:hypothetical protein
MWTAATAFTLYLEDLRDLLGVVREVSTAVDMETDDAIEIASLDELAAERLGRPVRSLTITGSKAGKPQAIIRLGQRTATVWVASDSASHFGVITKAQRVMWRHPSKLAAASLWPFALVLGLVMGGFSFADGSPQLAAICLAPVALVIALARLEYRHYAHIVLLPQSQAPGFLARQRENIAVTLIVGIVSGIAVLAIGWLVQPPR